MRGEVKRWCKERQRSHAIEAELVQEDGLRCFFSQVSSIASFRSCSTIAPRDTFDASFAEFPIHPDTQLQQDIFAPSLQVTEHEARRNLFTSNCDPHVAGFFPHKINLNLIQCISFELRRLRRTSSHRISCCLSEIGSSSYLLPPLPSPQCAFRSFTSFRSFASSRCSRLVKTCLVYSKVTQS